MKNVKLSVRIGSAFTSAALAVGMVPAVSFAVESDATETEAPVAEQPAAVDVTADAVADATTDATADATPNPIRTNAVVDETPAPAMVTGQVALAAAEDATVLVQVDALNYVLDDATDTAAVVGIANTAEGTVEIPQNVTSGNRNYTVTQILGGGVRVFQR